MTMTKRILLLILTFLLGAAVGGVSGAIYTRHQLREAFSDRPLKAAFLLDRLSGELDLTPGQREKALVILTGMQKEIHRLMAENRPQIREAVDKGMAKVRDLLTEEQAVKLDEMRERAMKFGPGGRHRGGPPKGWPEKPWNGAGPPGAIPPPTGFDPR